jgi:serine/threonine protein phosphatase PrpC
MEGTTMTDPTATDFNREPIPPVLAFDDRPRGLYFTWTGNRLDAVLVFDGVGGPQIARFVTSEAMDHVLDTSPSIAYAIQMFGVFCQAYRLDEAAQAAQAKQEANHV